ncbi:hypothetical protein CERSUDRAFT_87402 [Gelatoporia subvermispora B]|uniref:Mitochondrial carrier n=1 Tax=Ceriporiopsis subvermispora (strain B) TaxID=914234 RepID=M2QLN2_CERS8|nr:hypothetical protein CERSUDRAFT_87402 [Gelatoporia subvermispora B]
MGAYDTVLFIPVLILTLSISLLISVPFSGAIVRLRANYNPKGLQLDVEGDVEPHTGPVVTSFFGMLRRVKRLEGWAGLYKGLMPTLLTVLIFSVPTATAIHIAKPIIHDRANTLITSALGLALAAVGYLIFLPATIITYRAITTPYKLSSFRPIKALRVLLTPTERRRPWVLYATPGLFAAAALQFAYTAVFVEALRVWLAPAPGAGQSGLETLQTVKLVIYVAVQTLSVAVLCPLDVMVAKLAVQRNHAVSGHNSTEQEAGDAALEEYAPDEEVIGFRSEEDPYLGFVDCFKKIVDEEGWKALYRVWWITMLGLILGGLSVAVQAVAPPP